MEAEVSGRRLVASEKVIVVVAKKEMIPELLRRWQGQVLMTN